MSKGVAYGRVAVSFWTDPDIKRALSAEQKVLLLYYFTSPHSNMAGLYSAPFEFTASLTGLSVEQVRAWTMGCLSRFLTYDEKTEEVLVHRLASHQIGERLDVKDHRVKALDKMLAAAHSTALVARFFDLYPDYPVDRSRLAGVKPLGRPLASPSEAIAVNIA